MQNQLKEDMKANITETLKGFARDAAEKSVRAVETQKHEIEKKNEEDKYRDKLRGFCRTIPLFLMAYGDENTSLKVFDQVVPADVFETVTSITLDDFRFLRDGGDYEEDGITKHFDGHVFDEVVFNDSCKEFCGSAVTLPTTSMRTRLRISSIISRRRIQLLSSLPRA